MNYKIVYQQLIDQNTDWQQLLNFLKQKDFCSQNNINQVITNNLVIIQKLKEKLFALLNLSRFTQIDEYGYHYLEIFKILLCFVESNKNLDEQEGKQLEMIIGTLLEQQILIQWNQSNLKQQKKLLLQYKLKGKNIQSFQKNYHLFSFDQKQFIKLCTISSAEKLLENVKKQISLLLYCQNFKWEKEMDKKKIDQHLLQDQGFESVYFSLIFYFLQQYCYIKYNDFNQLQGKLSKVKIDQRQRWLNTFISKAKSNNQDQIYLFMINHTVQFSIQKEEYFLKENIFKLLEFNQQKQNQIWPLLQKNYEENSQFDFFCQLKFLPLFKFKKIIAQFKKMSVAKPEIQNSTNLNQQFTNQYFNQHSTESQLFTIYLLFSNPSREFTNSIKRALVLTFLSNENRDINFYINELIKHEKNIFYGDVVLLLGLLEQKFKESIASIIKLYNIDSSFMQLKATMILMKYFMCHQKLANKKESFQIFEDLLEELSLKNEKEMLSLKLLFGKDRFQILFVELINYYLISDIKNKKRCMKILKNLVPISLGKSEEKIQTFKALYLCLSPWLLNYLILLNTKAIITQSMFKRTLIIIFTIIKQKEQFTKFLLTNLHSLINKPCYHFDQVLTARERQISDKLNFKLNLIQFLNSGNYHEMLLKECVLLYKEDPVFYEDNLGKINYFNNIKLHSAYFLQKETFEYCPQKGCFSLEDFNISLTETSQEQEKMIVQDWLDDIKDISKFKKLIPFFFNIIKRGESSKKLLSIITSYRRKVQQSIKITNNMKSLFQLFFNNSNDELQVMLLKLYSSMFPVPLIFQNPYLQHAKRETDLYVFNEKMYYVFQQSFSIINFSLSSKQTQIGKTQLINEIFYKQEKFETQDTCQLNNNTIDIMFDTQFNGSRNFCVADAHGQIPIDILIKILPLFRLWIIQVDSLKELKDTQDKLNEITRIVPTINHKICIIIRNHKETEEIIKEFNKIQLKYESDGIRIHKIIDLDQKGLDKSIREMELQNAQTFIFKEIQYRNKITASKNDQEFLNVIKTFDTDQRLISKQFIEDRAIIKDLEEELNRLIQKPFGFYDQEAFPIRSIEYKLKVLKEKQNESIQQINNQGQNETQSKINQKNVMLSNNQLLQQDIKNQITDLEVQIKNAQLSNILKIFCKIFNQNQVRKFNEINTYKLQEENQEINDSLMKLKKERDILKQKKSELKKESSLVIFEDEKNKEYKKKFR
ncbi:unnamed protein product (macronuclear) [Paramecium tetraurelia]|uniref:Uncharacterized protein n=1 Tax=Paramecium tetraurelia TaxID=5888 RepID=A0D3Q0_PARTE|nr:uncharacterized protein GSPATT00013155001 [Paramecium tetraurelia]CAK77667.1 unnamed protein product [Paramecium tetraurelia]|eukprot:XP_001445064.1 hypothetical protein (macronuclear) [Paramecium tetraurelia strain d4-2]